jgi:hypothetical protein
MKLLSSLVVLLVGFFALLQDAFSQTQSTYPTFYTVQGNDQGPSVSYIKNSWDSYTDNGDYSTDPSSEPECYLTSYTTDGNILDQAVGQYVFVPNVPTYLHLEIDAAAHTLSLQLGQGDGQVNITVPLRSDTFFNGIDVGLLMQAALDSGTIKADITEFDGQVFTTPIHLAQSRPAVDGENPGCFFYWDESLPQQNVSITCTVTQDGTGYSWHRVLDIGPYLVQYTTDPTAASAVAVSGDMDFGQVTADPNDPTRNATATRTLTITNTGNLPMTVSSVTYPDGYSGDWSGGTLGPGGSEDVTVTFAPSQAADYGGTITVSSDAASGTNTIAVTGQGVVWTPPPPTPVGSFITKRLHIPRGTVVRGMFTHPELIGSVVVTSTDPGIAKQLKYHVRKVKINGQKVYVMRWHFTATRLKGKEYHKATVTFTVTAYGSDGSSASTLANASKAFNVN